ncbi:MAG: hypothetical protein ACK56I_16110, partial [bacterium]
GAGSALPPTLRAPSLHPIRIYGHVVLCLLGNMCNAKARQKQNGGRLAGEEEVGQREAGPQVCVGGGGRVLDVVVPDVRPWNMTSRS